MEDSVILKRSKSMSLSVIEEKKSEETISSIDMGSDILTDMDFDLPDRSFTLMDKKQK